MKKYVKYIVLLLVSVGCFVGIKLLYNNLSEDYHPDNELVTQSEVTTEGNNQQEDAMENSNSEDVSGDKDEAKAMDFIVEDTEKNQVSLYSKVGKPMVVNFWASWCSPCKAELPDFQLAYNEYGEEIEFMMVNLTDGRRETVEVASGFVNNEGYTFPVYYDVKQEAAYAYYVTSIPTTYFIDADGNIIAYAQGMIDYDTLIKGIDMIK